MSDEHPKRNWPGYTVEDHWPQALVMSMGTLFLLCGLALEIVQYLSVREGSAAAVSACVDVFLSAHPGFALLATGTAFTLLGYFVPRKVAK